MLRVVTCHRHRRRRGLFCLHRPCPSLSESYFVLILATPEFEVWIRPCLTQSFISSPREGFNHHLFTKYCMPVVPSPNPSSPSLSKNLTQED